MLTADLVQVRRRGELLSVVPLEESDRARALELASIYVGLATAHVGLERAALAEALREVPVSARERLLAEGLKKLLLDRCEFEEASALEPGPLRAELFARAAEARRTAESFGDFDRAAVVGELAQARGTSPAELERALYADLSDEHLLQSVDVAGPRTLVTAYEQGQIQAVLLRAVKVTARVFAASPATYRALFRKLKFLRLLHQIRPLERQRGYEIEIDGPFSLFESVTKYGLQLAMAFPALSACDEWKLEADVRWGKSRKPLRFRASGTPDAQADAALTPHLPDELATLLAALGAGKSPWRASVSGAVLELPGIGLCIPDLELVHGTTSQTVYVELLGYWSRDAVWKRVELVEKGLPFPIVFAVSKHLRVSEAALPDEASAALCVYARTLTARALLERVEAVAARAPAATSSASARAPARRPSRSSRSSRSGS